MNCPHCTADLPDDDLFCEECGVRLPHEQPGSPAPLCACGAPEGDLDDEGYCLQCGRRCRPAPGEHEEKELSPDFAGISDRGLRHSRNEDRLQIAAEPGRFLIVICDGVSSSPAADTAAAAATKYIAEQWQAGAGLETAIPDAAAAVARLAGPSQDESVPSTTVVAAAVENRQANIAWIGDSRAYWIAGSGSRQLTTDHSWLNQVVSSGQLSYAEAVENPQAHGITRWIGADAGTDIMPDRTEFAIPGPGWLVLCSDGLWNYAPETEELASLVLAFAPDTPAIEIAQHLVAYANEKGGSDNITVALLRFIE